MLQHHFLLSSPKRCGRKQLVFRVNFIQVFTGDGGFIYDFTIRGLQCWNDTKRILLKVPFRFVFKVDVYCVIPAGQKCVQLNKSGSLLKLISH